MGYQVYGAKVKVGHALSSRRCWPRKDGFTSPNDYLVNDFPHRLAKFSARETNSGTGPCNL